MCLPIEMWLPDGKELKANKQEHRVWKDTSFPIFTNVRQLSSSLHSFSFFCVVLEDYYNLLSVFKKKQTDVYGCVWVSGGLLPKLGVSDPHLPYTFCMSLSSDTGKMVRWGRLFCSSEMVSCGSCCEKQNLRKRGRV